jgi:hypothetical protein
MNAFGAALMIWLSRRNTVRKPRLCVPAAEKKPTVLAASGGPNCAPGDAARES